jgi:hypothetical protein
MEGDILDDITSVEHDSKSSNKADLSMKRFLSILKAQRNVPTPRCALKGEKKSKTIDCDSGCRLFSCGDVHVSDCLIHVFDPRSP